MVDTGSNTIVLSRPQGSASSEWQTSPPNDTRHSGSASPLQEDQRSSSLSDFDGELDEPPAQPVDDNDASSQVTRTENESEAETERLQDTPKVHDRFVNSSTGLTPSKLKQETAYDDSSDSQATPTKARSRTTPVAGRKRKRPSPAGSRDSPLSDGSDSDRALAKRRLDQAIANTTEMDSASAAGHETRADDLTQSLTDELGPDSPSLVNHKMRGRSRSRRARSAKDPDSLIEEHPPQAAEAVDEPTDQAADDAADEGDTRDEGDDEEADEDAVSTEAPTAEDVEKQVQAARAFDAIAKQFQLWRVKCQDEKIAAAEAELAELDEPDPAHIEYIRQMQCITARRDARMRQDTRLHQYKRQALRIETIAHRSQLLSQFYQEARDIREDLLYKLGKEWYVVQKERRAAQAEELRRYTYVYPSNRSEQLRQQARYNTEVSILAGIAKHVGFPAAPDLRGARPGELQNDLRAMKVTVRHSITQATKRPHEPHRGRNAAQKSEQLAQKEFMEQTPWANPRHAVHRAPATSGPNGSDPHRLPTGNAGHGSLTSTAHAPSPVHSTPVHGAVGLFRADQHDGGGGGGGRGSPTVDRNEGPQSDGPSSNVGGPAQGDETKGTASVGRQMADDGSPVARSKKRSLASLKALDAGNGGTGGNAGGRRNFSGVSSTSTIDAPPQAEVESQHGPEANGSVSYDGVDGVAGYGPTYGSRVNGIGARTAV